jgi:NAD(P)-dependent dehydrogenase (short-subunit alcohol dehydrogenase family)
MPAPLNPPVTTWNGRVVWLVGASTGIGRALAGELAARGARVVVSARRVEPLAEFSRAHPGSIALAMDVTEADAASRAVREVVQRHGGIDHVVYCAGHYRPQRASALDLRELQRHLDVNYVGALRVLDAVLPTLLAQRRGHVSLVASVAGYRGLPKGLAYGPTKAALINLAETLYLDLRGHGIGVSVVNPGFVRTPMTAANDFEMPALIDPDEAARAIVDGWRRGAFEMHFPKRFTRWLKLLRLLPYRLYFRAVAKATRL